MSYIKSPTPNKQTEIVAQNRRHLGYQKVSELIGGLDAWKKANYPIVGR